MHPAMHSQKELLRAVCTCAARPLLATLALLFALAALFFFCQQGTIAQDRSAQTPKPASAAEQAPGTPAAAVNSKSADGRARALMQWAKWHIAAAPVLQAIIEQHIQSRGLRFSVTGRYVRARGNRVRFELSADVALAQGKITLVCDGQTVWRIEENPTNKTVTRWSLKAMEDAIPVERADEIDLQIRQELAAEQGFRAIEATLDDLLDHLVFTRVEAGWLGFKGRSWIPVFVVEGQWSQKTLDVIAPKSKGDERGAVDLAEQWHKRGAQFVYVPRLCRVYLHRHPTWIAASSCWPYRIEWFGYTRPDGPDELLAALEMEPSDLPAASLDDTLFQVRLSEQEQKTVLEGDPKSMVEARRKVLRERRQRQEAAGASSPAPGK